MLAELAYWFLYSTLSLVLAFGWLVFFVVAIVILIVLFVVAVLAYLDWRDGTFGR